MLSRAHNVITEFSGPQGCSGSSRPLITVGSAEQAQFQIDEKGAENQIVPAPFRCASAGRGPSLYWTSWMLIDREVPSSSKIESVHVPSENELMVVPSGLVKPTSLREVENVLLASGVHSVYSERAGSSRPSRCSTSPTSVRCPPCASPRRSSLSRVG